MASTIFNHPVVGMLPLRLAPTSVEWTFNLVTTTTPTYAGEVVQLLAINFDRLIIEGRFGKEGPHGAAFQDGKLDRRPTDQLRDFESSGIYAIGLTQMTEYFQRYFAIASQGHDAKTEGHFNQTPMTLHYDGASDIGVELGREEVWQIYPINFPSYSRSLTDIGPVWRVECEVFEAPESVTAVTQKDIIAQLSETDADAFRPGVGYRPFNQFSDPFGTSDTNTRNFENLSQSQQLALLQEARDQANANLDSTYEKWRSMLPAYDDATLTRLIGIGGSLPTLDTPTTTDTTSTTSTTSTTPTTTQGNHGGSGG